jgi:hypothetical protein
LIPRFIKYDGREGLKQKELEEGLRNAQAEEFAASLI